MNKIQKIILSNKHSRTEKNIPNSPDLFSMNLGFGLSKSSLFKAIDNMHYL